MELYDIHTHDSLSADSDDEVPKQYINYILNVYPLGFEYAKDSDKCNWFSCGIHPWYSDDVEPQIKFLKEIADDNRIVAIGETGFDKSKGAGLETQRRIFEQQILLSEHLSKPLIIHCVKAWDELLAMKKRHRPRQPWIIHGYRGKPELTHQLLSHGFFFSVGEKFNSDSIPLIPLDRLFCETDESDISISEVYDKISATLGMEKEILAEYIEINIGTVFPLMTLSKNVLKDCSSGF